MHRTSIEDTIAAIATPPGQGGIGIVRLSGKDALAIAEKIFVPGASGRKQKVSEFSSHTLHYGRIVDRPNKGEEVVDEVLLSVMRGPKSFTCEDVVEISCHGGMVVTQRVLGLALDHGARLAEPGEFTKRAFLNGRIDLTQAEAVLDIIQAKTDAFAKASVNQLKGDLTVELEAIREFLMDAYAAIEALVNFPDEDVETETREGLAENIREALLRVQKLLDTSDQGRLLKEGVKIVICGRPNVGKSSLLNVLLKQPRAIVSHIPGTTRDTIEETVSIRGIPFRLVDTAGILSPRDHIEEEAIRRSQIHIDAADLVLFVLDASEELCDEDRALARRFGDKNFIGVLNKCDRPPKISDALAQEILGAAGLAGRANPAQIIRISALKRQGIEALEEALVAHVLHGKTGDVPRLVVSNLRQIASLKDCRLSLQNALTHFSDDLSVEFIAEEIKRAVDHLDAITGKNIEADLLDKIFSSFCIGK